MRTNVHKSKLFGEPVEAILNTEIIEAYVCKMQTQLEQWSVKLDVLKAKAEEAGIGAKIEYRRLIDDLKSKHPMLLWSESDARPAIHFLRNEGDGSSF